LGSSETALEFKTRGLLAYLAINFIFPEAAHYCNRILFDDPLLPIGKCMAYTLLGAN